MKKKCTLSLPTQRWLPFQSLFKNTFYIGKIRNNNNKMGKTEVNNIDENELKKIMTKPLIKVGILTHIPRVGIE